MSSLYVISAVGKDKPGLLFSVTNTLKKLGVNIVDVEAKAVRGHFIVFLVVDLATTEYTYDQMMEALGPVSLDFNLGFRSEPYKAGRRKTNKNLMIFTFMGRDQVGLIADVSSIFAENSVNIEAIRMIARGEYIATEVTVDTSDQPDVSGLRKKLYAFADQKSLDVSLRHKDLKEKPKKIVIFDCDSTIIQEEVIDELARFAGVEKDVKKMTDRAMNGELDFTQALKERVRLLKGLKVEQLEMLSRSMNLTPGAEDLISTLHSMGFKVGIISGGFSFFTNYLKERLNLEYVFANELEIVDGVTTGKLKGSIVSAERKGEFINHIAEQEGVTPDQIVAVGDGANDRFMLQNSGLAIAFNPKEILKEYSDGMIKSENISGLLYFMGISDQKEEIEV